ncbi:MAG: restriction endonuclease subunit S [Proteiniphilum sp.]
MKNNKKLIPELRFPEFENEGEWEIKTLSGICDITNGKANAQDHVDNGRYPLFDRSEVIKASDEFIFDCEAVIIPGEGMRFIPKYYEGKFNLHQRAYALKDFSCSGQFVYYSMLHRSTLLSQKAVQSTVLSLRLPILQDFPIEIPKKPEEQEKIASCLSSLDEVISAHSQKLELLKAHKKGLLQNLFPQEGEKVPKLRFKEFEKDGEWKKTILGKISSAIFDGTHQTPKYTEEGIPFFSVENIVSGKKNKFISREDYLEATSKNKPEKGDILITRIGNIGFSTVVDWDYEFSIYVTLAVIKQSDIFISHYLNGYFQSDYYQKEIRRKSLLNAAPMKINMNELQKTKVLLPPTKSEQQKIAFCLSSLDELILAQTEKIEQLKLHKKGLMQGLFPKNY